MNIRRILPSSFIGRLIVVIVVLMAFAAIVYAARRRVSNNKLIDPKDFIYTLKTCSEIINATEDDGGIISILNTLNSVGVVTTMVTNLGGYINDKIGMLAKHDEDGTRFSRGLIDVIASNIETDLEKIEKIINKMVGSNDPTKIESLQASLGRMHKLVESSLKTYNL